MSYNGSGTFNINSSGQPVVDGTTITATAFNTLTADLGTGLTTAICKDGQSTCSARINFAAGAGVSNGTVSVPALNFINDTGCGFYRIGSGNIGLAISGGKVLDITAVSVTFGATTPTTTAINLAGGIAIHAGGRPAPTAADINSFSVDFDAAGNDGARLWCFGPDTSTYAPVSISQFFSDGTGALNRVYIGTLGNVGIGPSANPNTSSALDINFLGAVLLPRLTSTQRDALTPVNGMILYNSTTDKFQGYQAASWQNLI